MQTNQAIDPTQHERAMMNAVRAQTCAIDGLYFHRYFFKQRFGSKMIVAPHHHVIQSALDEVIAGNIKRLIINVPPGYSKTEMASIGFMARGLSLNPRCRFLHISYSEALALGNSSDARSIVQSDEFQNMWQIPTVNDTKSKAVWRTPGGGGVRAAPSDGQITGFRAGLMEPGFTGAMIIDDPMKPKDAHYPTIRNRINENYPETFASRLAHEDVPVIVIMQRVDYNDLSGFLLRGGSGEMWHHLELPTIIDNSLPYPPENTHGIPIEHGLPDGWLWEYKHNDSHLVKLKSNKRVWQSQHLQRPKRFDEQGALWNEQLIEAALHMKQPWKKKRTVVGLDPATTNKKESDDHGVVVASSYTDENYTVDADYTKKMSVNQAAKMAINAYKTHDADAIVVETNNGGDWIEAVLRSEGFKGRVINRTASKGKFARAEPIAALYEQGKVKHTPGLTELEIEIMEYVPTTATHSPNRLDALVWAMTELSGGESETAGAWTW